MAAITAAKVVASATLRSPPARALIRFRVLREGLVSNTYKRVQLVKSWSTGSKLDLSLDTTSASGHEFTSWTDLALQTLVDQPKWVVVGIDDADPPVTVAKYMVITPGETHLLNITSGEASTTPTDPAVVSAVVRVAEQPASREIVVVEKDISGDWRIAGHGTTDGSGSAEVDLKVTGGAAYALGIDDFGVPFTPLVTVSVGQRIRPSQFAGVLYEVTEGGVLPAGEPEWWGIDTDGSRAVGTARAIAVRYYQPLAHGPFPVELL